MLTPQEVSQHAFAKANFGGYNMAMVDEFLDQLTEDYTALYKENALLKSKMKVLVDKVEEYRATEDGMRKALLAAQKTADEIVSEAEHRKAELVKHAEDEANAKLAAIRRELESEQLRLTAAQNATTAYVAKLKELYQHEMDYLNGLSQLTAPEPTHTEKAAREIEDSMQKMMGEETAEAAEDTMDLDRDLEALRTDGPAGEGDGGLYAELLELGKDQRGKREASADGHAARRYEEDQEGEEGDEPTRRIDPGKPLLFGKNYDVK